MYEYLKNSVGDIQFILMYTYSLYLYFRKGIRAFLKIALAGYGSLIVSFVFELEKGMKALVLIIALVIALILSYKELEAIDKQGIDAKTMLKPEVLDFVIFIVFVAIWTIVKMTLLPHRG